MAVCCWTHSHNCWSGSKDRLRLHIQLHFHFPMPSGPSFYVEFTLYASNPIFLNWNACVSTFSPLLHITTSRMVVVPAQSNYSISTAQTRIATENSLLDWNKASPIALKKHGAMTKHQWPPEVEIFKYMQPFILKKCFLISLLIVKTFPQNVDFPARETNLSIPRGYLSEEIQK